MCLLYICVQEPIHIERPLEDVIFKSLTLKTVHGRKIFHTWRETERIMHQNLSVVTQHTHTHTHTHCLIAG